MLFSLITLAAVQLSCDYAYYGAPFATVQLQLDKREVPLSPATVIFQGRTHQETVTPVPLGPAERVHLWLSKENPENAIELIVFNEPQAEGNSMLINPRSPVGRTMWGHCKVL